MASSLSLPHWALLANWDYAIRTTQSFEFSFTKNLIIWLKDGYNNNREWLLPKSIPRTQRAIVGYEEHEDVDGRKYSIPIEKSNPI